ncbi:MAG: hypothetical protein ACTSYO_07530, partial [Candidatus Ranarchaeia archaeon]
WDLNLTGGWERSMTVKSSGWEGEMRTASKLILRILGVGSYEGNVTFSISNGTPVSTLTPGSSISVNLNNSETSLWRLIKLTGLSVATGYGISLDPKPSSTANLTADYDLYPQYNVTEEYVLRRTTYPEGVQTYMDMWLSYGFSKDYDDYANNTEQREFYFSIGQGNVWLFINVPDHVSSGSTTSIPALAGTMNITMTEIAPVPVQVGTPVTINKADDYPIILSMAVTQNHFYRVKMTSSNYSVNIPAYIIFGELPHAFTGDGTPLAPFFDLQGDYSPDPTSVNSYYMTFQAVDASEVVIYVPSYGRGPITIELTDITYSGFALDGLMAIAALLGAAVAGVVVGIIIGKKKSSA